MRVDVRGDDYNGGADARLLTDLYSKYPNIKTWRIRNEPNIESPGRTPDDWYRYLMDLAQGVPSDMQLFTAAISPGTSDWLNWFRATVKAASKFKGVDAHIYGNPTEFETILKQIRDLYYGRLFITEYNFGAGREYNLNKYAQDWPTILELCDKYKVEMCSVFIWEWFNPDSSLKTTVNVKDTPMEAAMKQQPQPQPSKFKVAIVPSNQDKNLCVDGSNEMEQVASFVSVLLAQAPADITAKIFVPKPESLDKTKYEGLYAVQKSVDEWGPDLAINIHTDSGYFSHTGTYSDGSDIIKALCSELCPRLGKFIDGPCAQGNYYDYIFASIKAPAILLELGSHQMKEDIEALKNNASGISYTIWEGVKVIFGDKPDIAAHLDQLWASANQMTQTSLKLKAMSKDLLDQAAKLDERAKASYERIIAIKKAVGLE